VYFEIHRTTPHNAALCHDVEQHHPTLRPEPVGSGAGSVSTSVSVSDFRVSVRYSVHKAEVVTRITGQYYMHSHEGPQATVTPPAILGNDRFWSHPSSGGGSSGIEDLSRPILFYLSTPTIVYSAVLNLLVL